MPGEDPLLGRADVEDGHALGVGLPHVVRLFGRAVQPQAGHPLLDDRAPVVRGFGHRGSSCPCAPGWPLPAFRPVLVGLIVGGPVRVVIVPRGGDGIGVDREPRWALVPGCTGRSARNADARKGRDSGAAPRLPPLACCVCYSSSAHASHAAHGSMRPCVPSFSRASRPRLPAPSDYRARGTRRRFAAKPPRAHRCQVRHPAPDQRDGHAHASPGRGQEPA